MKILSTLHDKILIEVINELKRVHKDAKVEMIKDDNRYTVIFDDKSIGGAYFNYFSFFTTYYSWYIEPRNSKIEIHFF